MQTQLDMLDAMNRRDVGMAMAVDNANRHMPLWSDVAFHMLQEYIHFHSEPFMAEQVREYATGRGLDEPPSKRAWGGVINRAAKKGLIRSLGFRLTTNPQAHRTPATLWVKN